MKYKLSLSKGCNGLQRNNLIGQTLRGSIIDALGFRDGTGAQDFRVAAFALPQSTFPPYLVKKIG